MNLEEFTFDTPVAVNIINPATKKKTDAVIHVLPNHSKKAQVIMIDYYRSGNKENMPETEFLSKLVTSWENISEDGKDLEFTEENVKYVLDKWSFIQTQVSVGCGKGGYSPKLSKD